MNLKRVSIYLSLILRHKPEQAGIKLDKHGWAKVDGLIKGVSKKYPITIDILEEIVRTDEKQRYSFNEDHTLIRANQGHSIPVDLELQPIEPPRYLFHGTGKKYQESIENIGLISKERQYVHLSSDIDTAINVGKRHGEPVVYLVDSGEMYRRGFIFYQSKNGVWLTERVPVSFITRQSFTDGLW